MNADILDSLTERVLGAIFEVSNTLSAGLRPYRLSSGEFPEAQSGAVGGAGASACQPGARSRVGRRKRLPHDFSWDFAGRRPIPTDDKRRSSVPHNRLSHIIEMDAQV